MVAHFMMSALIMTNTQTPESDSETLACACVTVRCSHFLSDARKTTFCLAVSICLTPHFLPLSPFSQVPGEGEVRLEWRSQDIVAAR